MPSLLTSTGIDGTIKTGVAANYLKTAPSTKFGTRDLAFFNVDIASVEGSGSVGDLTHYTAPQSVYSTAVRAIQQVAEIYAVGAPTSNGFFLIVSTETLGDNSKSTPADTAYSQAKLLRDVTGATVTALTVSGAATFA